MSNATTHMLASGLHTTDRKIADLQRLLEVSKALVNVRDLEQLLSLITRSAIDLTGADRGTIFLVDYATNELFCRITDQEMKEIRFPVGVGIAGAVAATGASINIPDAYADERFNKDIDRKTGYRTRNILTMPLKNYEDKVIGVLQILNKLDGPFSEYDESIMEAMGSNAAVALENAQLLAHLVEKQKIEAALSVARDIQSNLLPKDAPELPGYDIGGVSYSADETGGDYFDYFVMEDGRLCALVGDVSGHGVGAALLMATARAFLKALVRKSSDIQTIMEDINTLLERDSDSEKFMTMFLMVLDPKTHEFQYISAGHDEPQYWIARDGNFIELDSTGMPLGILGDMPYDVSEPRPFEPGDYIFISTDGIWEAPNKHDDRYGKERLLAVLRANQHRSSREMAEAVVASVKEFTVGCPQADDLTVNIIKRLPE